MLDCFTGFSYYPTVAGLVIITNINLENMVGPIYDPIDPPTIGTTIRREIDNPPTYPAEQRFFYYDDELFYKYYIGPVTEFATTVQGQYNEQTRLFVAEWTSYGGFGKTHVEWAGPADADMNGFINGNDLDIYLRLFENGCQCADLDGNGFITGDDFDDFMTLFEEGGG
ncbi:MAG: EF-hand domain-containing protein [Phycisphaerales bacterium]|nr:EF-hand domain-containing protein [Phycisphaerales bacterium]